MGFMTQQHACHYPLSITDFALLKLTFVDIILYRVLGLALYKAQTVNIV